MQRHESYEYPVLGIGVASIGCGNRAAGIIHGVYSGRAECHSDRRAKVGNRGRAIEVKRGANITHWHGTRERYAPTGPMDLSHWWIHV